MARAFWDALPADISLDVALHAECRLQHEPYPSRHHYVPVDWRGVENRGFESGPGWLVGDTPVTEVEGRHYPLEFLARRLDHFHGLGLGVDAIGVGVDRLESAEARELFRRHFLPIRTWTVRSTACQEALLDLGVSPQAIRVGADWAWLYRPRRDCREWARAFWSGLGVDPARPLLVANVVNLVWRKAAGARRAVAAAFDELAGQHGFQIAFFCSECRPGELYDHAASNEIRGWMRRPAVIVPNQYWSPDQMLGLLAHAAVTVSQRYHFTLASVLAGTVPVTIVRSQKMETLLDDLGERPAGRIDSVTREQLAGVVMDAVRRRREILEPLLTAKDRLRKRAGQNLLMLEWKKRAESLSEAECRTK